MVESDTNEPTDEEPSTAELEAAIVQAAERIASSLDRISAQLAQFMNPETGVVMSQREDIAPGFNRAMMVMAIRDQLPEIMKEASNPTVIS